MHLYLVRHGDTEIGPDHLYPEDARLTALGRRQAAATGEALAKAGITHIFTSTLERAIQSAERLVELTGLRAVALPDLDEVRIGELRSAPMEVITRRIYRIPPLADFSEFYGENAADFSERVLHSLSRDVIDAVQRDGARVALVIHGGTISVILDHAAGKRFDPRMPRMVPNGSITTLSVSGCVLSILRGPESEHLREIGISIRPSMADQAFSAGSGDAS